MIKQGTSKAETLPIYQKIALDLAAKIADKQYLAGEKIYTRSSLASQYAVSSETARKAICILSDLDIVSVTKGSGVTIVSYENASRFLQQFHDVQTVHDLKNDLLDAIACQKKELDLLQKKAEILVETTNRFKVFHPFSPFEVKLTEDNHCVGKTLNELHFWQQTAATVIAVRRGEQLFLSPGPYLTLAQHDILYFIGDDMALARVRNFLFGCRPEVLAESY